MYNTFSRQRSLKVFFLINYFYYLFYVLPIIIFLIYIYKIINFYPNLIKLNVIKHIINSKIFKKKPIVLMHLGAVGSDFLIWKDLREQSTLVTVDGHVNKVKNYNNYKKIINKECLISNKNGYSTFYITKDPDCSSLLEPNSSKLKKWYGNHRFKVKKKIKVKVLSINKFLKENKIDYIDWLVMDLQGIELELVKSLDPKIRNGISIIELEPGFAENYKGADKMGDVFNFMSKQFEFADIKFGYSYKIENEQLNLLDKKTLFRLTKPNKFYANIVFNNINKKSLRINFMKLIYLILNNSVFEARNFLFNHLKNNKLFKIINKKLNQKILFLKLIYLCFLPFFLLQKIFKLSKKYFF